MLNEYDQLYKKILNVLAHAACLYLCFHATCTPLPQERYYDALCVWTLHIRN